MARTLPCRVRVERGRIRRPLASRDVIDELNAKCIGVAGFLPLSVEGEMIYIAMADLQPSEFGRESINL